MPLGKPALAEVYDFYTIFLILKTCVHLCPKQYMKKTEIKSIFRPSLFWDAGEIDAAKHAAYIIARVLDFGNIEDVHALRKIFPDEKIIETIRTRRSLLPKTGKYWAVKLNIPLREVLCLKKYYYPKPLT